MAKKSVIAREKVRQERAAKAFKKREELRQIIRNPNTSFEDQADAVIKLQKSPRNESATRVTRRCRVCGRTHAVYRKFGLCRLCLRGVAMKGYAPGLVKASW